MTKRKPKLDINAVLADLAENWTQEDDNRIEQSTIAAAISRSLTGVKKSEIHRRNAAEAQRGRVVSTETKARIGARSKGRTHSEHTKKKLAERGADRVFSEETKKKISLAKQNQPGKSVSIESVVYNTMSGAAAALNLSRNTVVYRLRSTGKEWVRWFYVDDGPKTSTVDLRVRKFVLKDPEGVEYTGHNLAEFCRSHPEVGDQKSIARVLRGEFKQLKGWTGHYLK